LRPARPPNDRTSAACPTILWLLRVQKEGDDGFDVICALPRPLNSAHGAPPAQHPSAPSFAGHVKTDPSRPSPDRTEPDVAPQCDDPHTSPIGTFAIANTGGWQSWQTIPANISGVTGVHNVYVTFTSGQPSDYVNLNWLTFGH
jgi:hypothetical protein